MKTPLYKRYADRRPVGSVCLCNTFGVLVFEPMEEDKPDTDFITAWSGSEGQTWGYHRNTPYIIPPPGVATFVKVLYGCILMKL